MNPLLTEAVDTTRASAAAVEDACALSAQVYTCAAEALTSGERLGQATSTVASQAHRISALSEILREIANKTDLLAVNTAVEGSRDGESRREFARIAMQMQRIAATATDAAEEIQKLEGELRQASAASVLAAEESTKRARAAVDAAKTAVDASDRQRQLAAAAASALDGLSNALSPG